MIRNTVERQIMWGDLDALGIVFYPRYYEWIDGCAHLFFESLGLNLNQVWQDHQLLFGLVETSCRYFKPGRYHHRLRIVTGIEELTAKTVTLEHRIEQVDGDALMVEGIEKRICLDVSDPELFRARDIPPAIYAVLARAAAD